MIKEDWNQQLSAKFMPWLAGSRRTQECQRHSGSKKGGQIDQPPANVATDLQILDRALPPRQAQSAGDDRAVTVSRRLAVGQAIVAAGAEANHPVPQDM